MRRTAVVLGLGLLICCLGAWTAAAGSHGKHKGKAGGAAVEHRSERAAERSNAQWSEGATRGQDRADQVRSDRSKQKAEKQKKDKKEKKASKEQSGRDSNESEDAGEIEAAETDTGDE